MKKCWAFVFVTNGIEYEYGLLLSIKVNKQLKEISIQLRAIQAIE